MKTKLFASSGAGITLSAAALALLLTVPVLGQTRVMSAVFRNGGKFRHLASAKWYKDHRAGPAAG
jgi:hypothetical protein